MDFSRMNIWPIGLFAGFLLVGGVLFLFSACEGNEQKEPPQSQVLGPREPTVVDIAFMEGAQLTQTAQMQLGGALKAALERGGVAEAVPYCQTAALPLTDSVGSTSLATNLRRTAMRYRNPANAPNAVDVRHMKIFMDQLAQGDTLMPQVEALPGGVLQYSRPILTQGMCLPCHGTVGESLATAHYEIIQSRYPQDSAIGFALGELRGIWSVQFSIEALQAAMAADSIQQH